MQTGSVETVAISQTHLEFLGLISREMNPEMPLAFGHAHALRTLLDRLEAVSAEGTDAAGLRHL